MKPNPEEVPKTPPSPEPEEIPKTPLEEARGAYAHLYDQLYKKDFREVEASGEEGSDYANVQELALAENAYRGKLNEQRDTLFTSRMAELGDTATEAQKSEMANQTLVETVAIEANLLYTARMEAGVERALEQETDSYARNLGLALKWAGKAVVEKYRNLPPKVKYSISAGLFVGGAAVTVLSGGALGAILSGGMLAGRMAQRTLGAAGLGVAIEAKLKSRQERKEEEGVVESHGADSIINKRNNELNEKLFELEGGKQKKKIKRYVAAGAVSAAIIAGVPGKALAGVDSATGSVVSNFAKNTLRGVVNYFGFGGTAEVAPLAPLEVADAPVEPTPEPDTVLEAPVETPAEVTAPEVAPVAYIVEMGKGDSVWKVAERELDSRGVFKSLEGLSPAEFEAQKTYLIDAVKDDIIQKLNEAGVSDVDALKLGTKLNLSILNNTSEMHDIVSGAKGLSAEQMANIVENNEKIASGGIATHEPAPVIEETPVEPSVPEEVISEAPEVPNATDIVTFRTQVRESIRSELGRGPRWLSGKSPNEGVLRSGLQHLAGSYGLDESHAKQFVDQLAGSDGKLSKGDFKELLGDGDKHNINLEKFAERVSSFNDSNAPIVEAIEQTSREKAAEIAELAWTDTPPETRTAVEALFPNGTTPNRVARLENILTAYYNGKDGFFAKDGPITIADLKTQVDAGRLAEFKNGLDRTLESMPARPLGPGAKAIRENIEFVRDQLDRVLK